MSFRFDASPLAQVQRRDNGTLIAPAVLTRAGVFVYRSASGGERRELRPPEEVFRADSLQSFALVPVTDSHPDRRAYPDGVTADNARELSVGHVGETIRRDGMLVTATVAVTAANVVAKVEAGKTALSCGYTCDCEETPGVWQGQPYDAIQRNIRGNHVAIVDVARAGPEARIRLDGDAMVQVPEGAMVRSSCETQHADSRELMDPKELEALKADLAKQRARADLAEAELSKQTARADAAEKRIAEAEKARADAADPARVQAAVRARLELEKRAASLAPGLKLDGLVDAELKLAVIDSRDPEFSKHSRRADSVYVDARFDLLAPPAPAADVVRVDAVEPQPQDYRAEYLARISNAYKTPSGK